MLAHFTNTASNNAPVELFIKGDWFDRKATISLAGVVVAQVSRNFLNVRELFGGQTVCCLYTPFLGWVDYN
jgi:hypothetical protein